MSLNWSRRFGSKDSCKSAVQFAVTLLTTMGFDVNRFHGDVDEELLCPICSAVLDEPVQVNVFGDSYVASSVVLGSTM